MSYRQDNAGSFIAWRHPSEFAGRTRPVDWIEAVDTSHASSMIATWILSMTQDRSARLESGEDINVKWTGALAYRLGVRTRLDELQERVQQQFTAVTKQLRDVGALTQSEWEASRLSFRLRIDDGRFDRLVALPGISVPTELSGSNPSR